MDPADGKYVTCDGYMQNSGTSVPPTGRHGYGRKFFDQKGQGNLFREAEDPEAAWQTEYANGCRRKPLGPPSQISLVHHAAKGQAPSSEALKSELRSVLADLFNVVVADEAKWFEVALEQHGCEWVARALSAEGRSLAREGKSARALAEKFSMTPVLELRQFGLRFAPASKEASSVAPGRNNLSMISPGICSILTDEIKPSAPREAQLVDVSNARRDPEDYQRRYVAAGHQDNFRGFELKDDGAAPTGRRLMGSARCHLQASNVVEADNRSSRRLW